MGSVQALPPQTPTLRMLEALDHVLTSMSLDAVFKVLDLDPTADEVKPSLN